MYMYMHNVILEGEHSKIYMYMYVYTDYAQRCIHAFTMLTTSLGLPLGISCFSLSSIMFFFLMKLKEAWNLAMPLRQTHCSMNVERSFPDTVRISFMNCRGEVGFTSTIEVQPVMLSHYDHINYVDTMITYM